MLRVLVISLLIIGFVAGARRRARYNLYQRLLSIDRIKEELEDQKSLRSRGFKNCVHDFIRGKCVDALNCDSGVGGLDTICDGWCPYPDQVCCANNNRRCN